MTVFNCFKEVFNCVADIKNLIFVAKKNTLKATEAVKHFLCTCYHGPRFTNHQFDAVTLLKKIFEGVWDSSFEQSEQVKFAKFLHLAPTLWTIKLMQWIIKWPTTWSKLISTAEFITKYGNANSIFHSDRIPADSKYWNRFVSELILSFSMKI